MYLLVIYLLLLSFIILILFGRFLGKNYCILITLFSLSLCWLISILIFYEVVIMHYTCQIKIFKWINIGLVNLDFELLFDSLTSIMLFVVLTISFLVHFFSIDYMSDEPHFIRFYSYLTLFTIFMLLLITANNFIQFFFGWEGVGLVSYLLINFWFNRIEANRSALKAVIINRFGDFSLYLAILIIFFNFKTFNFNTIFSLLNYFFLFSPYNYFFDFYLSIFSLLALLLVIAAIGKSAQIGLHVWLPDAMEGPTPVSALIHAATMVTAGIFLLIRCSFILEYSKNILLLIMLVGSLTAFFSSTIGLVQNDIKKIIAYSTCSQLGYMMFACGSSNYLGSLFHLFNHAFFKALLFLGAGAIIHSLSDEQDLRKYGGLIKLLPFSFIIMFIGSLTLIGMPFLSGYYSKDLIIEFSYINFTITNLFIFWLGTLSIFFTSFYSFRLLYLTFFNMKSNSVKGLIKNIHESNFFITLTLFVLSLFSIFIGYFTKEIFNGIGIDIFINSIEFNLNNNNYNFFIEFLPFYIKLLPFFFTLIGVVASYSFYYYYYILLDFFFKNFYFFYTFYLFLSKKWFFDLIYFKIFIKNFLFLFYEIFYKLIDRGFLEFLGPLGLIKFINNKTKLLNLIYNGSYLFYLFNFILYFLIFFSYIFNYIDLEIFLLFIFFFFFKKIYQFD